MIFENNNTKIKKFNFTKDNFYVLMDFDRTITTSKSFGSWAVLENTDFINPNFKTDSRKLLEKYYPYEIDYSIDFNTKSCYMNEWYYKNMDLFYKYNLTYDILINCVKNSLMEFRPGFKDFIKILHDNNVPVIIISAGIGNVITEFMKLNNCLYDNIHIISNFIKFENNKMLKFEDTIIHSLNKNMNSLPKDLTYVLYSKSYSMLFGDLVEDLYMLPQKYLSSCLSFGFLEQNVEKNLDIYNSSFDIVLTNNSSFFDIMNFLDDKIDIFNK